MSYTLYLLWREYNHFVEIRQAWLQSPNHLGLARTRTIAISSVPTDINSGTGIRELAGTVGRLTGTSGPRLNNMEVGNNYEPETGGVRSVWLTRKVKDLEKVWQDRDKECARLEGGVGKLVKLGNKNERKGKTPEKQGKCARSWRDRDSADEDIGKLDTERGGAEMVDRFVLPKKRPTWKQGLLGLIGKKMTLDTSPAYIAEHNAQISEMRGNENSYPQGDVAFVRFASQAEAHSFARLVPSIDKKYRIVNTHIELIPEDIQWSNISMSAAQRKIRTILSWALTIFLIIIWAIPVAFVGLVSNVDTLCTTATWLAWICTLPK